MNLKTDEDVEKFVGDGKILSVNSSGTGSIKIFEFATEEGFVQRSFSFGRKAVKMDLFLCNPLIGTGKGTGRKIFKNQIEQFRAQGFEELQTEAGFGEGLNGAITWAKMGYEMTPKSQASLQKKIADSEWAEDLKDIKTLHDLMEHPEGQEFWDDHAFAFEGVFDLKKGSKNIDKFNKYLISKGEEPIEN